MRSSASDQSTLGKKIRPPGKLLPKVLPREVYVVDGLGRVFLRDRSRVQHLRQVVQPWNVISRWGRRRHGTGLHLFSVGE